MISGGGGEGGVGGSELTKGSARETSLFGGGGADAKLASGNSGLRSTAPTNGAADGAADGGGGTTNGFKGTATGSGIIGGFSSEEFVIGGANG